MDNLWVCETCHVLLGLDIHHNSEDTFNCVNCAVKYKTSDIPFLDSTLVKSIKLKIDAILPSGLTSKMRYRWLSKRTVGLQFDLYPEEIFESVDFDFYEYVENQLSDELNLFITVEFEL